MPDWIIHLGIAYILAKLLKIKDIRLILLGAIIPDIAKSAFLLEYLNIKTITSFILLEPFHTPFLASFVILSISLFNKKPLHTFVLTFFGASTHFILDLMQSHIGYSGLLLYPFSYKTYFLMLFWQESIICIILLIISSIVLIYAIFDKNKQYTKFKIKNLKYAIPLIITIIIFPFLTFNSFSQMDYLKQLHNKEGEIYFGYGLIVSENPLILDEMGVRYEIITNEKLKIGDWVSMKAVIKDGKIYPYFIKKHTTLKISLSIIGLIIFAVIWFIPYPKIFRKLKIV